MMATFVPIESVTLASSAASVTFSAIPQTFTDLVVRWSVRDTTAMASFLMLLTLNGTTLGSYTKLEGDGSTASSYRDNGTPYLWSAFNNGATSTSNTFSSGELYIPNYAGNTNKPWSLFVARENNTTYAQLQAAAGLQSQTTAISSMTFATGGGTNLVAGSTFHLYGIKNS